MYDVARGLFRSRNRQSQRAETQSQTFSELREENEQLIKRLQTADRKLDETQQLLHKEQQQNQRIRQQPVRLPSDLPLPNHKFGTILQTRQSSE